MASSRLTKRGYFGVVVYLPKYTDNVGTLWRTAHILGASFMATIGKRYSKQPSDTTSAARHVPLSHYKDIDDFWDHRPDDCRTVALEMTPGAIPVAQFTHPPRAIYIMGPEDGSLPGELMHRCNHVVRLPGVFCLNLAVAGSLILYDRVRSDL